MSNNMQWFEITPSDTLFFRDGRPFNQDETITLAGVKSIFPPSPATVAGAILTAYAKSLDWDGCGSWDNNIRDTLGTGDDINLNFTGVFLKKQIDDENSEILFPVPQHLVELRQADKSKPNKQDADKKPCQIRKHIELHELAFLEPSSESYQTDMGEVFLPEVKNKDDKTVIKPLDGYWITKQGLKKCLKLEKPECETLYHQSELWTIEPKVGIARDNKTHATIQGMLYSPSHIRLCDDVSIIIGVENAPDNNIDGSIILGGEARTASIKTINIKTIDKIELPKANKSNLIYIASSLAIDNPQKLDLKTACMPRLQRFGGWNSIAFEPRPLLPFLAAGTVLFMNEEKIHSDWQTMFNSLQPSEFSQEKFGYGQFFLGTYQENK